MQLSLCVAVNADHRHAIELPKDISHAVLLLKHGLASMTPSLKVIWVAAVLHEPCLGAISVHHVAADNGGSASAVCPASYGEWLDHGHLTCAV